MDVIDALVSHQAILNNSNNIICLKAVLWTF
jgi:hypothetical protein